MSTDLVITALDPMQMIQAAFHSAIENKQGLEVVDRILEQQKWMIEHAEREAFQASLRRIQDELKLIEKRGSNPETRSKYALTQDIDAQIGSLLQRERMSLSFEPRVSDKPDMVLIVGILSLGAYSKEYPLEMPADGKGAKGGGVMSRTHATGSAITYGKRYLKNMIFDLRFREMDDDGNAAAGETLTESVVQEYVDAIKEAPDQPSLKNLFAECWEKAKKLNDGSAKKAFQSAYEAKKRSFQ